MFVLTTLVYPVALALLCLGAGLLVDRASAGFLPAMLLPTVGLASLIVISQLSTYVVALAPATPYLLPAFALGGACLGWRRLIALAHTWRTSLWQLALGPIAYALALAPVLLAGRPTFSSYMALADSAVHMMGADFLIHHGQHYAHLDLHNSYGATIKAYYDTSYPSGADTLFGGSSFLLRLPLIWTFQPFTALMLATATGPAWLLAKRVGLDRSWAAMAALTGTLPALVYAYELIGSIKEITALPLILGIGVLLLEHRRWLGNGARGAIPIAILASAGIGALGIAFGAWTLLAAITLIAVLIAESAPRAARPNASLRRLPWLLGGGMLVLLIGALPTWTNLSGSLSVAQGIASTSNPGNLHAPLRPTQLLGIWLGGSYKLVPTGVALTLTSILVALGLLLAALGMGYVVRSGRFTLACWVVLTILLWLVLSTYATTWADAKTLMLTSPAVILMAWAGIAALRASPLPIAAPLLAFLLLGGVLVSDALQYHESNLAPTARYDELASIDKRFGGQGPTLFTDFDEYALYELRDMDVGGPDFAYPPPALATAAGGYGQPVALERIPPDALSAYRLIVTRRDPLSARPPAAYRLLWQGAYYQVWGKRPRARPALSHITLSGTPKAQCAQLARVVTAAQTFSVVRSRASRLRAKGRSRRSRSVRLVAALAPQIVVLPIPRSRLKRPPGWARARQGILMRRPGTLRLAFRVAHPGRWQIWLKGDVMLGVRIAVDGQPLGLLSGQLGGNTLVTNTLAPLSAHLSAGAHMLTITRPAGGLGPGDGGAAVLAKVFLTPAGARGEAKLRTVPTTHWRSLCGGSLQWVELV